MTLHTGLLLKGGGGGGAEKGSYTKEKGRAVLTLHTGLLLKRGGGVGWNTHMRTLNNTEWGGGPGAVTVDQFKYRLNKTADSSVHQQFSLDLNLVGISLEWYLVIIA